MPVHRTPWGNFPNLATHASIDQVTSHPAYKDAQAGDFRAARILVYDCFKPVTFVGSPDYIAPIIRLDAGDQRNVIPLALAECLARKTNAKIVTTVVQANVTAANRASNDNTVRRLVDQPYFDGQCPRGSYYIAADVAYLGSTIANLRGHIEHKGGKVIAANSLSAGLFSAALVPDPYIRNVLKARFQNANQIIPETLGFPADLLTNRESYFVYGLKNIESLRNPNSQTNVSLRLTI